MRTGEGNIKKTSLKTVQNTAKVILLSGSSAKFEDKVLVCKHHCKLCAPKKVSLPKIWLSSCKI